MATERGSGFGLTEGETAEVQRRVRGGETHAALKGKLSVEK